MPSTLRHIPDRWLLPALLLLSITAGSIGWSTWQWLRGNALVQTEFTLDGITQSQVEQPSRWRAGRPGWHNES